MISTPRSAEAVQKGCVLPSHCQPHTTLSFLNQDKDFLCFCASHNFCYSISTTIALRGASLAPKTRTNLLQQLGKREKKHFLQKHQDWQPTHGNAEDSDFFPCLHSKIFSFLLILSLSLHQTTHCPISFKQSISETPGHSTMTMILHQRSFCLLSTRKEYSQKNVILEKNLKLHFNSHLTHRKFSSWMDQLCKANTAKGKSFQKFQEKQGKEENTLTNDPLALTRKIKTQYKTFLK